MGGLNYKIVLHNGHGHQYESEKRPLGANASEAVDDMGGNGHHEHQHQSLEDHLGQVVGHGALEQVRGVKRRATGHGLIIG